MSNTRRGVLNSRPPFVHVKVGRCGQGYREKQPGRHIRCQHSQRSRARDERTKKNSLPLLRLQHEGVAGAAQQISGGMLRIKKNSNTGREMMPFLKVGFRASMKTTGFGSIGGGRGGTFKSMMPCIAHSSPKNTMNSQVKDPPPGRAALERFPASTISKKKCASDHSLNRQVVVRSSRNLALSARRLNFFGSKSLDRSPRHKHWYVWTTAGQTAAIFLILPGMSSRKQSSLFCRCLC